MYLHRVICLCKKIKLHEIYVYVFARIIIEVICIIHFSITFAFFSINTILHPKTNKKVIFNSTQYTCIEIRSLLVDQ